MITFHRCGANFHLQIRHFFLVIWIPCAVTPKCSKGGCQSECGEAVAQPLCTLCCLKCYWFQLSRVSYLFISVRKTYSYQNNVQNNKRDFEHFCSLSPIGALYLSPVESRLVRYSNFQSLIYFNIGIYYSIKHIIRDSLWPVVGVVGLINKLC